MEDSENNDFGSDILVEETKPVMVEEYEKDQNVKEKALVESIYTPYAQKAVHTTYAGSNKYTAISSVDPQQKFTNDLQQLKYYLRLVINPYSWMTRQKQQKDKKLHSKKEEFQVQLDTDLDDKLQSIKGDTSFTQKPSSPEKTKTSRTMIIHFIS